jgi:hypothetical protein
MERLDTGGMSNERDNRIVELAARASEELKPIRTDALAGKGFSHDASRIISARVALDDLLRQARAEQWYRHDAERTTARLQFLLRKLFTAQDGYGTSFYDSDKWREAYDALRAEVGMEVKD